MKKRIQKRNALLLAVLLLCTGCGAAKSEMAQSMGMDMAAATEEAVEIETAEAGAIENATELSVPAQENRKLIRTFELEIETREFEEVLSQIYAKTEELEGYVESASSDGGSTYYSDYNRYSNLTLRIPSDRLDGFVENVKENANVTYISESTEDITLQYVDTESRKLALETEQSRLMELLEKAETVEELIAIESRLSEVCYQLESYTSQLRTYDHQVDYSTVHISIREVERETKALPKTFWEEVQEKFGDSLYGIGQGARGFAVWFLGMTPYFVIWAVILAAIYGVFRRIVRRKQIRLHKKQQEEHQEETDEG